MIRIEIARRPVPHCDYVVRAVVDLGDIAFRRTPQYFACEAYARSHADLLLADLRSSGYAAMLDVHDF
jgi:hypothetical protein